MPTGDRPWPPEQVPLLSRGKHRSPRKGACFMEMASYLAGERWSDHPACTHPLLASVARLVNDLSPDDARSRLAPLIPSVIGLTGDDPRVDVRIALRCATTALPVAAMERQHALAVGVLACERMLDELDGRPTGTLEPRSRAALEHAPHALKWARRFARDHTAAPQQFRRQAAPSIVQLSVTGLAEACIRDPAQRLHDLLVAVVAECRSLVRPDETDAATVEADRWADACGLIGVAAPAAGPAI